MTALVPTRSIDSDAWRRFETTLRAKLPGASLDQLHLEIGNTFQTFLRETHLWREQIRRNVVAGQDYYELAPTSSCAVVTFILAVRVNGQHYRASGSTSFGDTNGTYQVDEDYTSIRLTPTPNVTVPKGLDAWVGLSLDPASLDLPCELIEHYFEMLVCGVLERMYGHVAKPYSNQELAEKNARKFHAAVTRARREVRGGDTKASPPWGFPRIAPGRQARGGRSFGW